MFLTEKYKLTFVGTFVGTLKDEDKRLTPSQETTLPNSTRNNLFKQTS